MFVKNVNFYYRQILEKFENSYFAEDLTKVIIGIDCDYLDANELSFSEFKAKYYEALSKNKICDFAGFFGVLVQILYLCLKKFHFLLRKIMIFLYFYLPMLKLI